MLELLFPRRAGTGPKLLLLGAHSDDIEIGAGGTVLRLLERLPGASVLWVVFSAQGQRAVEAETGAALFLEQARERRILVKTFRESYFPYVGHEIKDFFEDLKQLIDPDLIFTHFRGDLHQDHQTICNLTWNTFRRHTILEYEIPKWDGDMGRPNVYVPLDSETCRRKVRYVIECFKSQSTRHWFTEETFMSLLRLRGVEAGERYAEAFFAPKLVLG